MTNEINLIACGRNLGKIIKENEDYFAIGSSDYLEFLNIDEYKQWDNLMDSENTENWKKQYLKTRNKKELETGIEFLISKGLAFDKDDKSVYDNLIVSRNGQAIGLLEGQTYGVRRVHKEKNILMTKEQYLIWISATGTTSLTQVLENIRKFLNCSQSFAEERLWENVKVFLKTRLWIMEKYSKTLPELNELNQENLINNNNLALNSVFMPVGQTAGYIEENNILHEGFYISINNNYVRITALQHLVWSAIGKSKIILKDLCAFLEKDQKELVKEVINPLLEKQLIIFNELENYKDSLRFLRRGIALKKVEDNYYFTTLSSDKPVGLPDICFIVWSLLDQNNSFQDIVTLVVENSGASFKETEVIVKDAIFHLLQNDLISILFLEDL
ncbi:hypothetical protein P8610_12945 [Fictibacillus sp. UD]|uniref:hypothetical protein n=1 Tax=Fictibacillus sp. UD TaxID=3038777 RepID=UPI00374620E7